MERYLTRDLINRFTSVDNNVFTNNVPVGGILDQQQNSILSNTLRPELNYSNTWGKHELYSILGLEVREVNGEGYTSRFYGYDDETAVSLRVNYDVRYPQFHNGSMMNIPFMDDVSGTTNRFISRFANFAYTYDKRFTLSASARKDASNLFGVRANQKGVPLWSIGGAWNISNEKFYSNELFPFLKARVTYGFNGNIDNSVTAFPTARADRNSYLSIPAVVITNPGNPDLRWEKVGVLNVGLDFTSRNRLVSGSIEYYSKKGKDIFAWGYTSAMAGFGTSIVKGNYAEIKGQGVDLNLNVKILQRELKWDVNALFNFVDDIVSKNIREGATTELINLGMRTRNFPKSGYPLYSVYSYQFAGLDNQTGDPLGILDGAVSKDYSQLNRASFDDLVFHGRATPSHFGSLRNTFSWRGASLSFNLIYKLGYFIRREYVTNPFSQKSTWSNTHSDFSNRWKNPGDEEITNIPSFSYPYNSNRYLFYLRSSALVESADHIRFQDINLSYRFNNTILKRINISGFELYSYINNIGIIWRKNDKNLDPDAGDIPPIRTVAFGVRVAL